MKKIDIFSEFPFTFNKVQEINATTFNDLYTLFPQRLNKPHRLNFYAIHLYIDGSGIHRLDFNEINVQPRYMLFINKGQVHSFDPGYSYNGKTLIFTESFFCKMNFHRQFLSKTPLYNDTSAIPYFTIENRFEELVTLFDHIVSELKRPVHGLQEFILHNYLFNILLIAESQYQPVQKNETTFKQRLLIAHFKKLVDKYVQEHHLIGFYARKLNVSIRTLQKAFQVVEDKSPKAWLMDRIILEIKRYLTYEDLSVKEIAYMFGFKEVTNFTKFFKDKTGTTPSTFRKSLFS